MKTFNILLLVTVCCFSTIIASPLNATETYAQKSGVECEVCHIDPLGGGDLSEFGKGYHLSISPETLQGDKKQSSLSRIIRLILLYIHIITAFMWFGTILYVHLVLKPAYASKGLPSGEVKVGLVSIVIMAITGAVLTYYKVPSISQMLTSNFGILLLIKIIIFSIMVSSAIFVVFVIGPKLKKKKTIQTSPSGNLTFAELANFDGEEGRSAYFAYKGKIYDVSNSKLWRGGSHMKRHQAGVDLTDTLSQAPHDESKILSMPAVGSILKLEAKSEEKLPQKVFYFMAYMNLGLVFTISLILALWRW
jgi:predicted heme/steroid binding protein/uncharacterized membrane protein